MGDGAFLLEAGRRLCELGGGKSRGMLLGVDVNPAAVQFSTTSITKTLGKSISIDMRLGDFFGFDPPNGSVSSLAAVDSVIGNPPYIRFQVFNGSQRSRAMDRAMRAGVALTRLSSSWAPFVVHAASFLRQGGRMALVLPEEIVHANYAAPVRAFLRRTFRRTALVSFSDHIFPESQERVVLLLADDKQGTRTGTLHLVRVGRPQDLRDIRSLLRTAETHPPGVEPDKWEPEFADQASHIVKSLAASGSFIPLQDICRIGIGYVSGANDFFVLRPSEARALSFPQRFLSPTLISAKQLAGAVMTRADFQDLLARDERCLLWTGSGESHEAVAAHIRRGQRDGISRRYKCRTREPWFKVPGVSVPTAFLTYMSSDMPRLVLNDAGLSCSNNLHAVAFSESDADLVRAAISGFHNSATILWAERVGRRYGGGVLKLEPSEAARLLVPDPKWIHRLKGSEDLLQRVDAAMRAGRSDAAVEAVDTLILKRGLGLPSKDLDAIREARLHRLGLRQRSSPGNIHAEDTK